ncbi:hypothetical protein N9B21_01050 [Verrucomicrobiales bacterium]|nr:hypothetical protein [Verrucomicrobiales bacterium]MDA7926606.1 hypothetical protein [Verrucomicrobiales bacterium]
MTNKNLQFEFRRSAGGWALLSICWVFAGLLTLKRAYESGTTDHIAWLWLLLGLIGLFDAIRRHRTKETIRVEEDEVLIGFSKGKSCGELEPITSMDRDQVEYHLYSKKYEISIKMKRLPEHLRVFFDRKCKACQEFRYPKLVQ